MIKLYSERDAARVLSLSYGYLKELRRRGEIGCVRIGKAVRYTDKSLEEFVNKHQELAA
jgi:excisionase family DNA binding protein